MPSGVATGRGGGAGGPIGSGKWKIRKFAIWEKMTPNYSAVLDFDYHHDIDSSDDVLQEYNLLCNMFRMWKREDTQNLPRTTGKVLKYLNDKNLVHVGPISKYCHLD